MNTTNTRSMKTEKVTILNSCCAVKDVVADRQSNQTLLVSGGSIPDSDSVYLEDSLGYRYARNSIGLELKIGADYYIFNMI